MKYLNKTQLSNAETSELVISFLGLVEKYQPAVMGVKPFYDLLKELEPQLGLLNKPASTQTLTSGILADIRRVKELNLAIATQTKAAAKSKVSVYSDALFVYDPLVKKYVTKSYRTGRSALNDNLRNFVDAANATENTRNAAKALGIDVYIAELGIVKSRMDQKSTQRSDMFVAQRTVKQMQLRKAINKAMSDLLKAIELAQVTNKEVDFVTFNTEMEVLFTGYRTQVRNRSTRRLNNVIKKESVASTTKSLATETLEGEHV